MARAIGLLNFVLGSFLNPVDSPRPTTDVFLSGTIGGFLSDTCVV
jgi:hypothetical protein